MKDVLCRWRWALLLLLVLGAMGWGGCATTAEEENSSARPWNTPEGFDNNLPGGMLNPYH
jgi:hypothetical protein